MKTIDVSWAAREYQRSDESDGTTATAFENGAAWMRAELTRWHDPKEELPEDRVHVLVKKESGACEVAFYDSQMKRWFCMASSFEYIVGWREIHE